MASRSHRVKAKDGLARKKKLARRHRAKERAFVQWASHAPLAELARNPGKYKALFTQPAPYPLTFAEFRARKRAFYSDPRYRQPAPYPLPGIYTSDYAYGWKQVGLQRVDGELYFSAHLGTHGIAADFECPRYGHVTPEPSCTCGFYALKLPPPSLWSGRVLVCVALSGHIIEASDGYRAQHQEVLGVWIPRHSGMVDPLLKDMTITEVRASLGIPVNWLELPRPFGSNPSRLEPD